MPTYEIKKAPVPALGRASYDESAIRDLDHLLAAVLLDRDLALDRAIEIPEERRAFIRERWPYWDEWAKKPDDEGFTFVNMSDEE